MNRVYFAASGEVVERPKAPRLKRGDEQSSVGSNPTLSAKNKKGPWVPFWVLTLGDLARAAPFDETRNRGVAPLFLCPPSHPFSY